MGVLVSVIYSSLKVTWYFMPYIQTSGSIESREMESISRLS